MSTIHLMYPDAVHHEITRRLRAADDERLRRLARHSVRSTRRSAVRAMWR
jgi:hypothetical protein